MEILAKRISKFNYNGSNDDQWLYWYEEGDGWMLNIPECGIATLRKHFVTEHDGTITVVPSIKTTGHFKDHSVVRHGYLTKGIWRE